MHIDKAIRTLQELRIIQKRYVDRPTPLGEIQISIMAEETADVIEDLLDELRYLSPSISAIRYQD